MSGFQNAIGVIFICVFHVSSIYRVPPLCVDSAGEPSTQCGGLYWILTVQLAVTISVAFALSRTSWLTRGQPVLVAFLFVFVNCTLVLEHPNGGALEQARAGMGQQITPNPLSGTRTF